MKGRCKSSHVKVVTKASWMLGGSQVHQKLGEFRYTQKRSAMLGMLDRQIALNNVHIKYSFIHEANEQRGRQTDIHGAHINRWAW